MNSFQIISWNIRQGGGRRTTKINTVLRDLLADVIVLSEFRNNSSGNSIRLSLLKAGYIHQFVGHAQTDENTVGIFSKHPCSFRQHRHADQQFPAAIIEATFPAFRLFGVYLPHKKKHVLFEHLLHEMKAEDPAILVGDFNSGRQFVDQAGNSFWYSDFFDQMKNLSYVDAFRLLHKDQREFSWFSHKGNGYRYDHSLTHEDLTSLIKRCYYLHEWRENGLSDHSPMVLKLGLGG